VDKDRRTAEQRDELAPSYVEHGASPPLRALGAGNDYQPANGPQPCRQEITSKAAVRTGLPAHAAPLVGWSGMMRTIGAISDTHGLLRPQALAALAGCDPIIHAGDVSAETQTSEASRLNSAKRGRASTSTLATIRRVSVSMKCAILLVSDVATRILPSGLRPMP